MADVSLTPTANPKELYGQGIRAYVLQDYDTAVRAFSTTSEILAAEHGDELHDSLGDVYLYYGKSLLELSRKEGGALGEGVLKNVEESDEEMEEAEGEEESKEDSKTEEAAENKDDAKAGDDEVNGGANKSDDAVNGAANKTDDAKTEEAKIAGDAKTDEEKESEKKDESIEEGTTGEASGSGEKKEGETEDELTDLQVAWEVLELAKRIFTNRGDDAKKNLAETLITLGEVSLESGNFASAIEDMSEGLKIQKTCFGNDSRTIAETCYKLGGAYSTNGQIDEAVESFNTSNEYLQNKVSNLQKDEEHKEANAEEIEELNNLIPEIQEKIADMKTLKTEIENKMTAQVEEAAPKSNGTSEASSSKQVNNISHLVKRKRKEEETPEEQPAKKPSP